MREEHRELPGHPQPVRRALVVDDHPSFRRCARAVLDGEGFVVDEAENGESAISIAAELEPELVLLDVQLPDIDGFEVAARLLAHDPELAIVLVSSRDGSEYGSLIAASGARGFLPKADLTAAAVEQLLL